MSSDIEPIHLDRLLEVVEELFGADYGSRRLGTPGRWGGSDLQRLGLDGPVERFHFENLFTFHDPHGRIRTPEGWMTDNPVVGQRLTFEAKPEISALWALGNPRQRQEVASSHANAVSQTMSTLHSLALLESERPHPVFERGCLFASFTEGAAEDLTPRLRTSVLICQQYRLPDGQAVGFPLELAPGTARTIFERCEWRHLSDTIGVLGMTPGTRVPDSLFKPITDTSRKWPWTVSEPEQKLSSSQMMGRWRAQAAKAGFGPVEVQQVFDSARRLGRGLDAHSQPLSRNAVGALWAAMTRTGAREQRKDRHGPEHGPER